MAAWEVGARPTNRSARPPHLSAHAVGKVPRSSPAKLREVGGSSATPAITCGINAWWGSGRPQSSRSAPAIAGVARSDDLLCGCPARRYRGGGLRWEERAESSVGLLARCPVDGIWRMGRPAGSPPGARPRADPRAARCAASTDHAPARRASTRRASAHPLLLSLDQCVAIVRRRRRGHIGHTLVMPEGRPLYKYEILDRRRSRVRTR